MARANSNAPADDLASLEALYIERGRLERAQLAPQTETGYANDWRAFTNWARRRNFDPLPATPDVVTLFATDLLSRGRKTTTVRRLVAGVSYIHRRNKHPTGWQERVECLLAGALRLRPETLDQAVPLTVEDVRAIAEYLAAQRGILPIRNRAIVLVGFLAALRSASLVGLAIGDVRFEPRGAELLIRREKNDQLGRGRSIGLPHGRHPETCPVLALRAWIETRGAFAGPLFTHIRGHQAIDRGLTPEHIGVMLKRTLKRMGRPAEGISSHSLRAGLVTAAGEHNCGELAIAAQTGHRRLDMVRRYFRRRDLFRGNVASALDL